MNIAFEHESCFQAGHESGRESEKFMDPSAPIDWFALRSRLFAAHDLRRELDVGHPAAGFHRRGSFASPAASVLHAFEDGDEAVNSNGSGIGKSAAFKFASVAGGQSAARG